MSESKQIMVVDDEEIIRDMLCSFLQKEGYKTVAMNTGENAISYAEKNKPDLVLLDIKMPGLNGFETCYILNLIPPISPRTGVMIISGYASPGNVEESLNKGAIDVIKKPFDLDDVRYRISTWFDKCSIEDDVLRLKEYTKKVSKYLIAKGIAKGIAKEQQHRTRIN